MRKRGLIALVFLLFPSLVSAQNFGAYVSKFIAPSQKLITNEYFQFLFTLILLWGLFYWVFHYGIKKGKVFDDATAPKMAMILAGLAVAPFLYLLRNQSVQSSMKQMIQPIALFMGIVLSVMICVYMYKSIKSIIEEFGWGGTSTPGETATRQTTNGEAP